MKPKPQLPPHAIDARLPNGQDREIDLRLVRDIEVLYRPGTGGSHSPDGIVTRVVVHFYGGPDPLLIHVSDADRVARAFRVQQERRAAGNETTFSGRNLDDSDRALVEGGGTNVYSWTPESDGKGQPEQVHMTFDLAVAGMRLTMVQRFKTRGALNALIDALVKHREDVWPTT